MGSMPRFQGKDQRINEVLHKTPKNEAASVNSHVIFFPGDIQNFKVVMEKHFMAKNHSQYCFENTLEMLSNKFPDSHIWLVIPCKYMYGIICIYNHFVKTVSLMGVPDHTLDFDGVEHLTLLFNQMLKHLGQSAISDNDAQIHIAGFSKGCIVLNQLLYEAAALLRADVGGQSRNFIENIKSIYWLDGGHSGENEVWVNNEDVLNDLALLKSADFFVHTSPYQTQDPVHPWKGEMKKTFVETLKEKGFTVHEHEHFEGQFSLEQHFKVLEAF